MKTATIALLLLALVAVAATAPAPDHDDDEYYNYDYESYEDDDDDDDDHRLPTSMFQDLQPRPVHHGFKQPSACSWAVVHCCNFPDRMGIRASCFSRLGCSGAWFSDVCTPSIQANIIKGVLNSLRGH